MSSFLSGSLERTVSTFVKPMNALELDDWERTECLAWRYLKKFYIGRLNFLLNCSNDAKVLSMNRSLKHTIPFLCKSWNMWSWQDGLMQWGLGERSCENQKNLLNWAQILGECLTTGFVIDLSEWSRSEEPSSARIDRLSFDCNSIATHSGQSAWPQQKCKAAQVSSPMIKTKVWEGQASFSLGLLEVSLVQTWLFTSMKK